MGVEEVEKVLGGSSDGRRSNTAQGLGVTLLPRDFLHQHLVLLQPDYWDRSASHPAIWTR